MSARRFAFAGGVLGGVLAVGCHLLQVPARDPAPVPCPGGVVHCPAQHECVERSTGHECIFTGDDWPDVGRARDGGSDAR